MRRLRISFALCAVVLGSSIVISLSQGIDPLASLKDPDPALRRAAIGQIVHDNLKEDLKPLRQALEDPDVLVRESAAWALGLLPDPLNTSALIERYPVEKGLLVKAAMIESLGELRGPGSADVLEAAFRERSPLLSRPAAIGLGLSYDWKAAQVLLERTNDPSASVREAVAMALVPYKETEAKQALWDLAQDPVSSVKEKAAFGIKLQTEGAVFIETAGQGLVSKDSVMRRISARFLGLWGAGEAVKSLLEKSEKNDADPSVRLEAAQALAKILSREESARPHPKKAGKKHKASVKNKSQK